MWSVLTGRPVAGAAARGAHGRAAPAAARNRRRAGDRASDAAEAWVADLERLGARVVEARIPEPTANTWPQFQHEALQSHAATFPSRADEYGDADAEEAAGCAAATPEEIEAAYRAIEEWRRYEPEVDLYVSPCYAHRAPAGGRRRARGPAPAHGVPPLGEPDRLGRPRDREHAARRASRRDRPRRRARLGARLEVDSSGSPSRPSRRGTRAAASP